jgi:hypothetical protein
VLKKCLSFINEELKKLLEYEGTIHFTISIFNPMKNNTQYFC